MKIYKHAVVPPETISAIFHKGAVAIKKKNILTFKFSLSIIPENITIQANAVESKKPIQNIKIKSKLNDKIINKSLPVPSLKEIQEAYNKLLKKNIEID